MSLDYINSLTEASTVEIVNSLAAYHKAVDHAAIVSVTNKRGEIVFANDIFCEISQYSREELIGQDHRIINSGFHSSEFFGQMWKDITQGKVWHGEIRNKAKDGTLYWVDTIISPILTESGEISQFLSIRTLITERKKLEEERERLIADLLEKQNELMQFNFIISHNLRTPVGNIIGLTGLLKEDCTNCENNILELIDYIDSAAENVLESIQDLNQILFMTKSGNKIKEEVKIIDIIHSAEKSLEKEIRDSGAIIEIIMNDYGYQYRTIKTYLHSIFFNLISNAIKYKKAGIAPLVHVGIEKSSNNYNIRVADNGTGIDLQKVASDLFKPYKRFSANGEEGKGLGLYMTKAQIEALNGAITIESEPGKGTTFIISLPIEC
ncbi:MAG: PAS domain S-box protein [Bacteroidetes bacterium]|jgi:PAS domain S-box-containing protein|nr:PAS domain S-box protein [Bacteroidota bacterium]